MVIILPFRNDPGYSVIVMLGTEQSHKTFANAEWKYSATSHLYITLKRLSPPSKTYGAMNHTHEDICELLKEKGDPKKVVKSTLDGEYKIDVWSEENIRIIADWAKKHKNKKYLQKNDLKSVYDKLNSIQSFREKYYAPFVTAQVEKHEPQQPQDPRLESLVNSAAPAARQFEGNQEKADLPMVDASVMSPTNCRVPAEPETLFDLPPQTGPLPADEPHPEGRRTAVQMRLIEGAQPPNSKRSARRR